MYHTDARSTSMLHAGVHAQENTFVVAMLPSSMLQRLMHNPCEMQCTLMATSQG